jgi:hypothetical protein
MSNRSYVLIPLEEITAEASGALSCPDCVGGLGVHVDLDDGEWEVLAVHSVPCPSTAGEVRRLRLVPPLGGAA